MKKENRNSTMTLFTKETVRIDLKKSRNALSQERRNEARQALTSALLSLIQPYKAILSFHSLPEEIDTSLVNHYLAQIGKLHLPKVQENSLLQIYSVKSPAEELLISKWKLHEPDSSKCLLIDIKTIDCILVPGLGFDKNQKRIGYGKGHYDKLLSEFMKHSLFPKTIGIGFKEQLCETDLPCEAHDVRLDEVKLF